MMAMATTQKKAMLSQCERAFRPLEYIVTLGNQGVKVYSNGKRQPFNVKPLNLILCTGHHFKILLHLFAYSNTIVPDLFGHLMDMGNSIVFLFEV